KGGGIYYASSVSEAGLCGAVKSALTLNDITTTVKAAGFKPIAELSLLNDSIFPAAYPDASYKIADGGSMWIDDALENGGKPWMTPMSDVTRSYLLALGDEVAAAGFEKVICGDVVFPPFRESDLTLLGEEVKKSDRYLSLTSLVNSLYSKFISGGTAMMLEVSAAELLSGGGEVIQPMVLDVNTLVLNVDFDEIGQSVTAPDTVYEFSGTAKENADKIIGLVKDRLSDYNVVVRFSGKNTEQSELIKAKEVISGYGYSSYIIG
ncbi:MAG: putative glycoside hydrolase, partial [Ruminococcus sp.]